MSIFDFVGAAQRDADWERTKLRLDMTTRDQAATAAKVKIAQAASWIVKWQELAAREKLSPNRVQDIEPTCTSMVQRFEQVQTIWSALLQEMTDVAVAA